MAIEHQTTGRVFAPRTQELLCRWADAGEKYFEALDGIADVLGWMDKSCADPEVIEVNAWRTMLIDCHNENARLIEETGERYFKVREFRRVK